MPGLINMNGEPLPLAYVIELCIAGLSILGSLFVLFVFVCYKSLRSWPFELVAYLCLSSMLNSISYTLYFTDMDKVMDEIDVYRCKTQAFIMIWFENSQFLWAMLIGYSIYESIVIIKDDSDEVPVLKRTLLNIFAFGIPLVFSSLALIFDVLGPMGNWCWIGEIPSKTLKSNEKARKFSIEVEISMNTRICAGLLIGFCLLAILINWCFIYSTIRSLNSEFKTPEERKLVGRYINRISLFPLVQTLCMLPSFVNKFIVCFFSKDYFVLNIIQTMCVSSQGLWYALIYGCNRKVKGALKETFERRLCCKSEPTRRSNPSTGSSNVDELNKSDRQIAIIDSD